MGEMKIKINHGEFAFEIEGESKDVKEVFDDVKNNLVEKMISDKPVKASLTAKVIDVPDVSQEIPVNKDKKSSSGKSKISAIRGIMPKQIDLPLNKEQFKQLSDEFAKYPKTGGSQTAVVILMYVYKKITGVSEFEPDMIFSLMRIFKIKVPKVFSQMLLDIKSKKNHIIKNENGTWSLNFLGEQTVEEMLLNA